VLNLRDQRGYSMIEVIMVVAVVVTLMSVAIGVTMHAVTAAKSDGSTAGVMNALEVARNQSTSQRRDFQIVFTLPNKIEIFRIEIPSGASTLTETRYLENGQEFLRYTGVPDTPDLFGHTGAIAFGSSPTLRFTSDGTLIDSSGDVLNGTLFLGLPSQVGSARAVTVFGATGLIRSWTWNGTAWVN
jgi:prepilin-type N-terminal cleavage/methylation domain-containing protein